MHVLARGDILQRLRLASGLVLFTFAATHFANHALGLVSLDAMHVMQGWRKVVTRSWPGSILLVAAFATHISLALFKLSRRMTWRLPPWELVQIATGFAVPLLLITHVAYNRGAATLAGTDDTYAFELANSWPGHALMFSGMLVLVWVHGCIGLTTGCGWRPGTPMCVFYCWAWRWRCRWRRWPATRWRDDRLPRKWRSRAHGRSCSTRRVLRMLQPSRG